MGQNGACQGRGDPGIREAPFEPDPIEHLNEFAHFGVINVDGAILGNLEIESSAAGAHETGKPMLLDVPEAGDIVRFPVRRPLQAPHPEFLARRREREAIHLQTQGQFAEDTNCCAYNDRALIGSRRLVVRHAHVQQKGLRPAWLQRQPIFRQRFE